MSECKTVWKYLQGSEKDFEGAPEWAKFRTFTGGCSFFAEGHDKGDRVLDIARREEFIIDVINDFCPIDIIARREPITNVTVNISTPCGEDDLNDCIGAPESSMERIERNGKVWGEFDLDAFLAEHGCQQSELLISRCNPLDITIQGIPINEISGTETVTYNKYLREIKPGVWVDVYDVLMAWSVTNPALQHLIKKALQTGERGHKTREQDLQDIIDSAIRAKELEQK